MKQNLESKWEEMVRKAEGLGMQEVVDYYTDAWEKALKEYHNTKTKEYSI